MKYTSDSSKSYSELSSKQLSDYLIFRDLPAIANKYISGDRVLDYGCGTGRSSRLLSERGYEVAAVDVSKEMLRKAREVSDKEKYVYITSGVIPAKDGEFDAVVSTLTFFEIPTLDEMQQIVDEMARVLKDNGIVIMATSAEGYPYGTWRTIASELKPNNERFRSGDVLHNRILCTDLVFDDYYWTDRDQIGVFEKAGFQLVELLHPLGKKEDGVDWKDEWHTSPWSIFVFQKQ